MARKASKKSAKAKEKPTPKTSSEPVLLSGGNPQIPKGHGDAPVEAYLAAMPGWKQEVGRRLDELIVATVPGVRKAVKWNTPLYGVAEGDAEGTDAAESGDDEQRTWFLGFHCITKYVKVAFFRGASLAPPPPVASKQADVRYFHIHENDQLDESQLADWVQQASRLPGERM